MQTKNILVLIVVLAITVTGWWIYKNDSPSSEEITTFNDCVNAGYPVRESYPRQCQTPDGMTFTESIDNSDLDNFIKVSSPNKDEVIKSPLQISGQARGNWFFEASFPISIVDANNNILGTGIATAKGDWMTEEFVDFEATINFATSTTETGQIILKRDNPSGLTENDKTLIWPIRFNEKGTTVSTRDCIISGCSGQICGEKEMASTCEYRPEYTCYQGAKCARNQAGVCAWVQTPALKACLNNS